MTDHTALTSSIEKADREWPFKPGDWVSNDADRIAKVKAVYGDAGEVLLDLVIYDHSGKRVGRESPACGGPKAFEPACDAQGWERVGEPSFPITPKWVPTNDGGAVVRMWAGERLPPAHWIKPRKARTVTRNDDTRLRAVLQQIANGHNDPRALALRALPHQGGGNG